MEIYVGNFEDIILEEQYDYILLNGVLEYGALYISTEHPYEDFIKRLKNNLKPTGKILIAIENRFGLKYWCGCSEDHTGLPFDGINGYVQNSTIRTFSKSELEELASICDLNINFYYVFPDYKFPKIIYTDQSLQKNMMEGYSPYYCAQMNMVLNEEKLYQDVLDNQVVPFFANSYFVELSRIEQKPEVEFVKFNNDYRDKKYNLCTYLKKDKFYKKAIYSEAVEKINDIKKIDKILTSQNILHAEVLGDGDEIYSKKVKGKSLFSVLKDHYEKHNIDAVYKIFDDLYELMKKSGGKKVKYTNKNIFDKYGIKVKKEILEKLSFYENGIIDIFANNIIVSGNKYVLIDQEWFEENTPIEYIMYRASINFFNKFSDGDQYAQVLFKKYHIDQAFFEKLDKEFLKKIYGPSYDIFKNNYRKINFVHNLTELIYIKNVLQEEKNNLQVEYDSLKNENIRLQRQEVELDAIINSKRYKFINRVANAKNRVLMLFKKK